MAIVNIGKTPKPFTWEDFLSPLLRGDLGVCFFWIIILLTTNLAAQESQVIYSGLENATSIYATQDYLFVVESDKNRLLKLDHEGELIETLGGLGSGDYQFDRPVDVDATNGLKIYISDYRNNRIQIYDRRFQYLGSITGETAFQNRRIKPTQLVVNDFGELFVYDESSRSILKFDENGSYIDRFLLDTFSVFELDLDRDQLRITDREHNEMLFISQNGILGESFPLVDQYSKVIDTIELETFQILLYKDRIEKKGYD